jgi:1-deoxy-D-xylulose-5-phosphate synthase
LKPKSTEAGALDQGLRVRVLTLPDRFLDHDKPDLQYAAAGLSARAIVAKVLGTLPRLSDARARSQPGKG